MCEGNLTKYQREALTYKLELGSTNILLQFYFNLLQTSTLVLSYPNCSIRGYPCRTSNLKLQKYSRDSLLDTASDILFDISDSSTVATFAFVAMATNTLARSSTVALA